MTRPDRSMQPAGPPGAAADPASVVEFAPAKLNLALHVTGRRGDGYHLLDSLVVFAGIGDRVRLSMPGAGLTLTGPFADRLSVRDNLCLDAARLAGARVAITLDKALPPAAGIGGGSADAAAVLRGLARLGLALPGPAAIAGLGADLPVCLHGRPARIRGVGEVIDPVPDLPELHLVLVNPGVSLATPAVFAALRETGNPGLPDLPRRPDAAALLGWLRATRNDLQAPALQLAPVIAEVLAALDHAGAGFSRMSGSGASCFGLFADPGAARAACARIRKARTRWWVHATGLAHRGASG